ncbi:MULTISPECIES: hypothetical protein [Hungatella]|uniref:hypothetical protein n=1 Tax=Hungatella TaxID=1649459 RepID=UPI001F5A823B|nr:MULTISPECIES: hypothetical protein [Hungatella]
MKTADGSEKRRNGPLTAEMIVGTPESGKQQNVFPLLFPRTTSRAGAPAGPSDDCREDQKPVERG